MAEISAHKRGSWAADSMAGVIALFKLQTTKEPEERLSLRAIAKEFNLPVKTCQKFRFIMICHVNLHLQVVALTLGQAYVLSRKEKTLRIVLMMLFHQFWYTS